MSLEVISQSPSLFTKEDFLFTTSVVRALLYQAGFERQYISSEEYAQLCKEDPFLKETNDLLMQHYGYRCKKKGYQFCLEEVKMEKIGEVLLAIIKVLAPPSNNKFEDSLPLRLFLRRAIVSISGRFVDQLDELLPFEVK